MFPETFTGLDWALPAFTGLDGVQGLTFNVQSRRWGTISFAVIFACLQVFAVNPTFCRGVFVATAPGSVCRAAARSGVRALPGVVQDSEKTFSPNRPEFFRKTFRPELARIGPNWSESPLNGPIE